MSGGSGWFDLAAVVVTVLGTGGATLWGVKLGGDIAAKKDAERRRREAGAHWAAMSVEISTCSNLALGYLVTSVDIPAYRLPVIAFEHALPRLLAEPEAISDLELDAITKYYTEVHAFNRGLDYAHETTEDSGARRDEVARVHMKATNLISGKYFPNDEGRFELERYDWLMSMVAARLDEHYPIEGVLAPPSNDVIQKRAEIARRFIRFHTIDRRREARERL